MTFHKKEELQKVSRPLFTRELAQGESREFCPGIMVTYKMFSVTEHLKCSDVTWMSAGAIEYTAECKDSVSDRLTRPGHLGPRKLLIRQFLQNCQGLGPALINSSLLRPLSFGIGDNHGVDGLPKTP